MHIGIDIGSTKVAIVIMNKNKEVLTQNITPTTVDMNASGHKALASALQSIDADIRKATSIVATGYGRKLVQFPCKSVNIPEITAIADGAKMLHPEARTIIDIGGQDSKVIKLDENGDILDFKMNDICAAGTGRFIENMARVLDVKLDELTDLSRKSTKEITMNSVCAVFAESEVISRMSQGASKEDIIAAIHRSVASKVGKLARALRFQEPLVFTGGVAKNDGVRLELERLLGVSVHVPEMPQFVAAFGASLEALN